MHGITKPFVLSPSTSFRTGLLKDERPSRRHTLLIQAENVLHVVQAGRFTLEKHCRAQRA